MDFRDKNGKDIQIGSKIKWMAGRYYSKDEGTEATGKVTKLTAKVRSGKSDLQRVVVKSETYFVDMPHYIKERREAGDTYRVWSGGVATSFPSVDGNFRTIEVVEDAPEGSRPTYTEQRI